jgi:hypothetical protein
MCGMQTPLKLDSVTQHLRKLEVKRFHGVILIRYEEGKIIILEESRKVKFTEQLEA